MALTTLLLCPHHVHTGSARASIRRLFIGLGFLLWLPLFTACGDGGSSISEADPASPGTGQGTASTLGLSPASLAFSATQGGNNPAARTIVVSNTGNGSLNWNASTPAGWLLLSRTSGTTPASFTIRPIIAGLGAGAYSTTVTIIGNGATNSPQTIPIDVTISSSTPPGTTPPPPPPTASVTLAWDPVQDTSVTGYYVHFGLQSPSSPGSCTYTQSVFYSLSSLPNKLSPSVAVTGLTPGARYYFSVSAYNGLESPCSSEVSTVTDSA